MIFQLSVNAPRTTNGRVCSVPSVLQVREASLVIGNRSALAFAMSEFARPTQLCTQPSR